MECKRCHNTNPKLFGLDGGTYYCRRCCAFGRLEAGEDVKSARLTGRIWKGSPSLAYDLTENQKRASHQALLSLKEGKDVFVYAAAGAGKTEITFESICWYLSQGKKPGFAISRRQVVLEIAKRLASAFPALSVIPVCEGYTKITDADLIVCTTHQLYRYPDCFDLLILDELDAFPYCGDEVLESLARRACRGQKLLLSATPDPVSMERIQRKEMVLVELFERPHGHALPVPKLYLLPRWLQAAGIFLFCLQMRKKKKQVLVFVPRRQDGKWFAWLFSLFFRCRAIDSQTAEKDEIMDQFRNNALQVLFSTTLLERGITVPDVQAAVYHADHSVFTAASLIQIYGRVGRSFSDPEGTGLCFASQKTEAIKECISQIQMMNNTVFAA